MNKNKLIGQGLDLASETISFDTELITRLGKENAELKAENEKLKYLLGCADAIIFPSNILERDHDSEDKNNGKWRYQREWTLEPITRFDTAIEAFEAMQKREVENNCIR